MDYSKLYELSAVMPLSDIAEHLSAIFMSSPSELREGAVKIILLYIRNNPGGEVTVGQIHESMSNDQGKIVLPYGGLSEGIGVTFQLEKMPPRLIAMICTYITISADLTR